MIKLEKVNKSFSTPAGPKIVAADLSAIFPTNVSVALLGRNGAGKSTLLEMIGGKLRPDSGRITVTGSVSWPVGFSGSFHRNLTGAQNVKFIARVYGVDTDELIDSVRRFADIGAHFYLPVRNYSAGMRSRLAFGVSIGIPFDTYLVDEVTSVGDAAFRRKSKEIFLERLRNSGAIVVSHNMDQIKELCMNGAVLEDGKLTFYNDLDEAIFRHQELLKSK